MYHRLLKNKLKNRFFQGKAIILVGARQTGKTTLAMELISSSRRKARVFNCDNPTDRDFLNQKFIRYHNDTTQTRHHD